MSVEVQPSRMTAGELFERQDDGFQAVGDAGELTGGDMLPGFRCPVWRLFPGAIREGGTLAVTADRCRRRAGFRSVQEAKMSSRARANPGSRGERNVCPR